MIGPGFTQSVQLTAEPEAEATKAAGVLAPRPKDLAEAGLGETLIYDLVVKHLYRGGLMDIKQLAARLALAGPVLEPAIAFLRNESYVEVLPATQRSSGVRHNLTDRGRRAATEALAKSGYIGPAPVTLEAYRRVVEGQSVRTVNVTRNDARRAFADVVAPPQLVDRLGSAVNSGRPLFLYGPPGTGKTYLGKRLVRMVQGDDILVPYALLVGDTVVQVYDPAVHARVETDTPSLMMNEGHDPRFVRCQRPEVLTGGELTLDMLNMEYDPATNLYHAPQSLMANNGLYMIDDLGRQRMTPDALLNRWILPMEEGRDFLAIGAGQRFEVPFDVILIFSTNLNPLELADEAFLRRLGHKVRFRYTDRADYEEIWKRTCSELGLEFDRELLSGLFELYDTECRPLLACHPRDLLNTVVDRLRYDGRQEPGRLDMKQLQQAWNSYFVSLEESREHQPEDSR